MTTETISIAVDAEAARALAQASTEDRRKLELLLSLRLKELVGGPSRPLSAIMDQMSAEAQARGLTPEALESLLQVE
ncbi:MAG TPA: hypothetical protein VFV87_08630 [Pirellulaceae bacterium]|nr:hypothetical protein [Pirellulaceae bacterium]